MHIKPEEPTAKAVGLKWNTRNGHQPEWHDKAGGYTIQGIAAKLVNRIEGNYNTLEGLPLCILTMMLKELRVDI